MGSFANSLHVRADNAELVAYEIGRILENRGFQPSSQTEGDDPVQLNPSIRVLQVTEAHAGWVGVLDSDLMGLLTLALELSSRLQTHAICVMVNDSDSWHYELFHKGHQVDGFDSPGASPLLDLDELPDEVLELPDADELAEAMDAIMDQMPGLADLFQSLLPDEMREIHRKIADGSATDDETERFSQWSRELADSAAADFGGAASSSADGDLPVAASNSHGNGRAASRREIESHLHHLRPLLVDGTSPDRVGEILRAEASFAEEPMADFLEMIGVNPFFARLSLQYLEEFTSDDLLREGIGVSRALWFVK